MLNYLTEEIQECLKNARDCARKAAAQTDPKLEQDFLKLEKHWLSVARSYTKRLSHGFGADMSSN
jgi:hypothetical protein